MIHKSTEYTPDNIVDRIEELSNLIRLNYKQPDKEQIDSLLENLDGLVQLSTDNYMTLGDPEQLDIVEPDYSQCLVNPSHFFLAKKYSNQILLKLISGEFLFDDDQDDSRMDRASRLLAHMAGRGAAGSITRTWHIPYLDKDKNRNELLIPLHEPCYVGNDLGFKTWGAAPMMAKKLLQQHIIPDISEYKVLELGTGTGMVGIVCDYLGANEIHVTDYHPRVLENVSYNVELNKSRAKVSKLDFIQVANDEAKEWKDVQYDIVIASDLIYEMDHAEYLPVAVNKLMKDVFYLMIPLRDTHWEEVNYFENKMKTLGLVCRKTEDYQKDHEEEGLVKFRYYEYVRQQ